MKNQKTTPKLHPSERLHETDSDSVVKEVKKIPAEITRSMWKDFFEAALKQTVPEQVFGGNTKTAKHSGELKEGQEISLHQAKKEKPAVHDSEKKTENKSVSIEHHEYFRETFKSEAQKETAEQMQARQQLEVLQSEIHKLIKASQEMEAAFKQVSHQVTVEQGPKKVGKYDVSFLEWVLLVVRSTRMRIEDGQTWMTMFASKKRQKQFWSQFKKGGTSFLLSGERSTATQTG